MRVLRLGAVAAGQLTQTETFRRREVPAASEESPPVVVPASFVSAREPVAEPQREQAVPYTSGGLTAVVTPGQAGALQGGGVPWGLFGLVGVGFLILSR